MLIYLDNASTTQIDDRVLEAMMPYLQQSYGNAGTLYRLGKDAAMAIDDSREQVANLIGASPEQILFTSGGTESNNMVFIGIKEYLLKINRTHIITSQIEHDSVLRAVKSLCRLKHEFDAEFIAPEHNSGISSSDVLGAINKSPDSTGLVSVMYTNNETGINNDIIAIGNGCKDRGVLFHTDCVQAITCNLINVNDIGCDFLSLSSHKIHGCKGVGALFARDKTMLSPLIIGGKSQEFGLRGGTENVAGIVGFGKACEILKQEFEYNSKYVTRRRNQLYGSLSSKLANKGLQDIMHINGNLDLSSCGKTINLRFDGIDGETLLLLLDNCGVYVSAGSACRSHSSDPSHVLIAMGITPEDARNSIRISLSKQNTVADVERAAKIIAECVATLAGINNTL